MEREIYGKKYTCKEGQTPNYDETIIIDGK